MSKIIYIGYYDDLANKTRRFAPSAVNKMNYIINSINELGFIVYLVSLSMLTTEDAIYEKGSFYRINKKLKVKYFSSFRDGAIIGLINRILLPIKLFIFLFFLTKKNDIVIVYHNTFFSSYKPIKFLKALIGFTLILEVEEVYSNLESGISFSEEKKIFDIADKFIFSTELLDNIVNTYLKPSLIIYGSYEVSKTDLSKFDDNRIHVVYAGTFDPRKGGAAVAAAVAAFLPENYIVHIMGFGSDTQVQSIKSTIDKTSKVINAKILFEGCLLGKEYTDFLQKCHIGLSTQYPDNVYNETSFPSKILSYMANGLQVVSIEIEAIKQSKIGNHIFFYRKQEPQEIAKAIIELSNMTGLMKDPRDIIMSLHNDFNVKLKELLSQ